MIQSVQNAAFGRFVIVIKLSDIHRQLEYILNHRYENYENPDKVREADMDYLFKLEEAYKTGKPVKWGTMMEGRLRDSSGLSELKWGRIENGEYKD